MVRRRGIFWKCERVLLIFCRQGSVRSADLRVREKLGKAKYRSKFRDEKRSDKIGQTAKFYIENIANFITIYHKSILFWISQHHSTLCEYVKRVLACLLSSILSPHVNFIVWTRRLTDCSRVCRFTESALNQRWFIFLCLNMCRLNFHV